MQDRPTAAELLEAVRGFLTDELTDDLSGRKRFLVRVSANVLGIVERELAGEEDALRRDWTRLAPLAGADPDAPPAGFTDLRDGVREVSERVAARIRAGELDDRWAQTVDAVYASTVDKLRIANPSWLEGDDAEGP